MKAADKTRNERLQKWRRDTGADTHNNPDGDRYEKSKLKTFTCDYCEEEFQARKVSTSVPVCEECRPKHQRVINQRGLERMLKVYADDPQKVLRRRLSQRLERLGYSLEWFDSHTECGICGTDEPTGSRGWHIDHDHSCCSGPWYNSCGKCIRGLLCNACNSGLGLFRDDQEALKKAIKWLKKSEKARIARESEAKDKGLSSSDPAAG